MRSWQAWAHDYIRFQGLPAWQKQLRTEIQNRCQHLNPSVGKVLHTSFFGPKPHKSDVENIMLYNIRTFAVASGNGIRFEHGADVPPPPSGREYSYCYRYALAPRSAGFADWQPKRTLASFDWTDLGTFGGQKKVAKIWLALVRERVHFEVVDPAAGAKTPFALTVNIRPPHGCQ